MNPQTSTLELQPAGEAADDFARTFLAGSAGAALQLALDALAAGDLAMALDQARNAAGVLEDLLGFTPPEMIHHGGTETRKAIEA